MDSKGLFPIIFCFLVFYSFPFNCSWELHAIVLLYWTFIHICDLHSCNDYLYSYAFETKSSDESQVMLDHYKKVTFFFGFTDLLTREWRKWHVCIFKNLTNESEFENLNFFLFRPSKQLTFLFIFNQRRCTQHRTSNRTKKHPSQPMNEIEKTLQETQMVLAWNPLWNLITTIGMCLYFSFICKSWRGRRQSWGLQKARVLACKLLEEKKQN